MMTIREVDREERVRARSMGAATEHKNGSPAARQIGANVQHWRKRRGMSQAALAATVGCDRSIVCRWEVGLRTPTLKHLLVLGDALGCGAAALLPDEGHG